MLVSRMTSDAVMLSARSTSRSGAGSGTTSSSTMPTTPAGTANCATDLFFMSGPLDERSEQNDGADGRRGGGGASRARRRWDGGGGAGRHAVLAGCGAAAPQRHDEGEDPGDGGVEVLGHLLTELARRVQGAGERHVLDHRDLVLAGLRADA